MIASKQQTTKARSSPLELKVLICQLNAKMREVDFNIARVKKSLEKYSDKDAIDVVLFPEMIFTGYNFTDRTLITSYAEEAGKGPTYKYVSELAKSLKAYVMCGYPEIFFDPAKDNKKILYNSMYVIDRKGNLLLNYRKHHLYETDEFWADEGASFQAVELENVNGIKFKAAVGICMDINPYKFEDPSKYEFSDFCKKEKVDAIFMSCAWLDGEVSQLDGKSIQRTINYWIYRLSTLCNFDNKINYDKKWAFFCANRVGNEGEGCTFTGSSCALKFNPVQLIHTLDKRNEGFLMAEVTLDP